MNIFYKSIESSRFNTIYLEKSTRQRRGLWPGKRYLFVTVSLRVFVNQGFAKRKVEPNVKPLWDPENDTKWRLNDTNPVKTVQIT